MVDPVTAQLEQRGRVLAVDVLRGITVALMILVNDPGDWAHVYWPLDHAAWNGWTLTDLIFPTFLFLAGCAIVFSTETRLVRGQSRGALAKHVMSRSAMLLLLGWFLAAMPRFHLTRMRFYGVLPRIALCALIVGLLCLYIRRMRTLVILIVALLAGYWILMRFVPVPGFGMPVRDIPLLDPDKNLAAWIDRWVHFGRLYERTRDPEGLLSTLPAVATTLLGVCTGRWIRSDASSWRKVLGMLAAGVILLAGGLLWGHWFPINKKLWTSSYVLLTAGWALLALAPLYWLLDVQRVQDRLRSVGALVWPWLVFGSNAIAAFVISEAIVKLAFFFQIADEDGDRHSLWVLAYETIFARNGSTNWTSHGFALAFVCLCFIPLWLLWRKRIFVRL